MVDLNIKKIINVYYRENVRWARPRFAPRPFDAIVFFTAGKIEYLFSDKSVMAQKGDVLFLSKDVAYSGVCHTDTASYYVLDFVSMSDAASKQFAAPWVFTPQSYEKALFRFSSAFDIWNRQQIDALLRLKATFYTVISEAYTQSAGSKSISSNDEIVEYIMENLGDASLKVSGICKRFFISESQLRRNFLRLTGLTPNEYISTLRINKAKNELICTNKPIQQISEACGFSSPYYFSNCFSAAEKMTPTAYRKRHFCI